MIFYKMSKLFIKGQSLRLKIFILYIGKRRNYLVISKLVAKTINYVRAAGKSSILQTNAYDLKKLKDVKLFYNKSALQLDDIAYHGSPYKFEQFNIAMIGSGEGAAKRGKGIYLFRTKKFAPYFANIKSPDAPLHLGVSKPLNNPNPHVYTVSGLKSMNLKKVSLADSKNISRMQENFERNYPDFDGIEMPNGEICVFPKSVEKLKIKYIDKLENFIMLNRGFPFRVWTTDKAKLTL